MGKKYHSNSSDDSWTDDFLDTLPSLYFNKFGDYISDTYFPGVNFNIDYSEEWHRKEFDFQLHVRMQQAELIFIPWVNESIDLTGKNILEIGCGTGSSTAAIAKRAKKVIACDISQVSLNTNQKRIELLDIKNVEYVKLQNEWLSKPDVDLPVDLKEINVVVCYALLEHLLIEERLNLLSYIWNKINVHNYLITFETPNRLSSIDWHTSNCLFAQILPDNLCAHYYSLSKANNLKHIKNSEYIPLDLSKTHDLYRLGMGVSFHEFELAIGFNKMKVVNDGFSNKLKHHRDQLTKWDTVNYEKSLSDIFKKSISNIPEGFAKASLDLIIEKL